MACRELYHTPVLTPLPMYVPWLVISVYSYSLLKRRRRPQKPQRLARNYRGASAHGTPLSDEAQCALHVPQGPGTGTGRTCSGARGGQLRELYGMGAGRCSVAGTGGGGRILENPRRCVSPPSGTTAAPVCVSCGSGWSVPCVSIQLTLSQTRSIQLTLSQTRPVCVFAW